MARDGLQDEKIGGDNRRHLTSRWERLVVAAPRPGQHRLHWSLMPAATASATWLVGRWTQGRAPRGDTLPLQSTNGRMGRVENRKRRLTKCQLQTTQLRQPGSMTSTDDGRLISEYIVREKKYCIFYANNLLIAKINPFFNRQSTITTSCSKVLFQDDTNVQCRWHSTHPPLHR